MNDLTWQLIDESTDVWLSLVIYFLEAYDFSALVLRKGTMDRRKEYEFWFMSHALFFTKLKFHEIEFSNG